MLFDWVKYFWSTLNLNLTNFVKIMISSIYSGLIYVMKETITLISTFPTIKSFPQIYTAWHFVVLMSLIAIGIIVAYMGATNLSNHNISKKIELKDVIGRIIYTVCLIILTVPFVDLLINFNNEMVKIFISYFNIQGALQFMATEKVTSNLIAVGLIIFQIFIAAKIMIGYWLRVAELLLMVVVSPIAFTLGINPGWASYTSQWIKRVVTLVFSQFIQILYMVIYSIMIMSMALKPSINNLFIAAALLILMDNVPQFLATFISHDNSSQQIHKTWHHLTNNAVTKVYRQVSRSIKPKVA